MKFRIYGMVLGLFFALGLVLSFGMEASAGHGGSETMTADQVDPGNEQHVRDFLSHIIEYYDDVTNMYTGDELNRQIVIYGRDLRQEGAYKHSATNMYSIGISASGTLTNHAGYSALFGYEFNPDAAGSTVAETIKTLIDNSGVGMSDCQMYGNEGRYACATEVQGPTGNVTVIAGLHHAADDGTFTLPDCAGFDLATNAETVYASQDDTDLEAYVKGVIGVVQQQVESATLAQTGEFLAGGGSLPDLVPGSPAAIAFGQGLLQKVYAKAACFGTGDFKHENIYAFIMGTDLATSTVLFNGNNFDLNGANLELDDDSLPGDDKSIAGLFNRALEGKTSAYVNYRWDDPTTDEDDVENFFRDRKVPGTSCKRSYIEVANINELLPPPTPEIFYIFGSGTYPGDEVCASDNGGDGGDGGDDDDGCAIAGAGHTSQSTLLNLFLIASVLFSTVFLRKRA